MAIDAVMSRITEIRSAMGATAASVAPGAVGGVMGGNTMATAMVSADTTRTTVTNPTQDFGSLLSAAVATSSIAPAASTAAAQSLTPAGTHTDQDLGQRIVNEARTWIGTPYQWGGNTKAGVDCSGLVKNVLSEYGIDMPRVARQQMGQGRAVSSLAHAQPGDLLVFDGGTHIGIYVSEGRMIDAPYRGRAVTERAIYETPTAIRRVIPDATPMNTQQSPVTADERATQAVQRAALDRLGVTR